MWFGIISLFPEILQSLQVGITGRALKKGLLNIDCWNPRDFATDKHQSVDDHPYGGGPGMVMMAEPLRAAIRVAKESAPKPPTLIYLSPQGKKFDQDAAYELAAKESIVLLAGRYEGIDERIIQNEVDEEWSIGDYILTGGELAAMVMIDVITRLIPGAIGDQNSVTQDSLSDGLLKYPQYTRPDVLAGQQVPEVLLNGNHKVIARWRVKQALGNTWLKRPDLLTSKELSTEERALLSEFIDEFLQNKARKTF